MLDRSLRPSWGLERGDKILDLGLLASARHAFEAAAPAGPTSSLWTAGRDEVEGGEENVRRDGPPRANSTPETVHSAAVAGWTRCTSRFPDATFDRGDLFRVLEHIPDDLRPPWRSLPRVLKPGGTMAITVRDLGRS